MLMIFHDESVESIFSSDFFGGAILMYGAVCNIRYCWDIVLGMALVSESIDWYTTSS